MPLCVIDVTHCHSEVVSSYRGRHQLRIKQHDLFVAHVQLLLILRYSLLVVGFCCLDRRLYELLFLGEKRNVLGLI